MKKVRIWYRTQRKRWYGEYWLNGKRFAKAFNSKRDAYLWQSYMLHKLNYEKWQGVQGIKWADAQKLYLIAKDAQGIADSTKNEIINTLKHFDQTVTITNTSALNQQHINAHIIERKKTVANRTVNKDLESLRAFYIWLKKNHYNGNDIEWTMLKTIKKIFIPPALEQLKDLFNLAKPHPPLYARMILALTLGVRRGAIERITLLPHEPCRIDLETGMVYTYESKTHQQIIKKLGTNALQLVINYIHTLPEGTMMLFPNRWDGKARNVWDKIRIQAGVPHLTFHNLRNISISLLADKGESSAVLQKHAGHKNIKTTERYIGINLATQDRVTKKLDSIFDYL